MRKPGIEGKITVMEEKKTNELTDKALDAVTGGASYRKNEETGLYDVFDKSKKLVQSYASERDASRAAADLSIKERYGNGDGRRN